MNTFKKPEIEVIKFEVQDIITASTGPEHDNAYNDITDFFEGE